MLVVNKPSAQPTLQRAIQITTTNIIQATHVAATLDILLKDISISSQQDASEFNRLNKNGFPVEFTFNSLDDSLRYATEVAPAEVKGVERLSYAERLLTDLGVPLPADTITRLRQVQTSGALEWGAWIGVRHRPEGDHYKLYVQVSDSGSEVANEMIRSYFGAEPLLPNNTAQLVAIGEELGTSRTEFYFKITHPGLEYWEIGYLLRRFSLAERQVDLLSLMEETRGYSLNEQRPKLPATTYGFSLSVSSPDEPTVFSLFTFAGPLLGGDGQIRQKLLSLAGRRGWNFRNYAVLTEPLADWQEQNLHHNAIAFIVAPKGSLGLHISLSPPEAIAEETGERGGEFPMPKVPVPSLHSQLPKENVGVSIAQINSAIEAALKFLTNTRNSEGWWEDFKLAPGCSDEWVTAYVGTAIASLSTPHTLAIGLKAWRWLISRRQSSLGWGYNALVPPDADSTLWALQLAEATGCGNWQQARQAREFLNQHVRPNGGIATYADDNWIRHFIGASKQLSFEGWCSPHTCVTAAAASLPQFRFDACYFLRQTQCSDGSWKSYWWCEDEYATALAAEALSKGIEPQDNERVQRAIEWALARINTDGSVDSSVQPFGSPFATAWILRILLLGEQPETAHQVCDRVVQWLLKHQNSDGSWRPSAALRVPPPNIIAPDTHPNWILQGLVEEGISLDQNGVFTTATVLQALASTRGRKFAYPSYTVNTLPL